MKQYNYLIKYIYPAKTLNIVVCAEVAELADARDSKSRGTQVPCGFDSHLRHTYSYFFVNPIITCYTSAMRNSPEALRERAKESVLAATEAYFLKSQSRESTLFERFSHIIEVEETRMSARLMRVTDAEIVQIYIPIMPSAVRQNYFSTVIKKCDISLKEAIKISKRFGLKLI